MKSRVQYGKERKHFLDSDAERNEILELTG
jgi:hypothetical protein